MFECGKVYIYKGERNNDGGFAVGQHYMVVEIHNGNLYYVENDSGALSLFNETDMKDNFWR